MPNRSAKTGRKVSKDFADKNPETTIRESKSKDTKRLDWLQKNHADVRYSEDREVWLCVTGAVDEVQYGRTSRSAIDAAIKAEKSK